MNKNMKMCSMLLGLVLFAACSSDDDEVVAPQPELYPLTIEVSENPMQSEGGGAAGARAFRAPITTTSSLTQFNLNYVYNSIAGGATVVAKSTDGRWVHTEGADKGWPNDAANNDHMVTWYATTNGTFYLDENDPYISFSGEEYANAQHDLLVAKTADKWSVCGGHLFFTFDHACTALRFFVKKSTNLNDYTLNISQVKLCHVVKNGKYYLDDNTWTLTNSATTNFTDYTLYTGDAFTLGSAEYIPLYGPYNKADEPYLFLIPQTLTNWNPTEALSNTYLEITCTLRKENESANTFSGTAYIPFAATLQKGYQNDVKINIGKNSLYSGTNTKIIN